MADEYISKEKVLNLIEHNDKVLHYADKTYEDIVYSTTQRTCEAVALMPAADVQPVKCGEWAAYNRDCRGYADCFKCSCCENYVHVYCWQKQCDYDYCPNCGARMDGDAE